MEGSDPSMVSYIPMDMNDRLRFEKLARELAEMRQKLEALESQFKMLSEKEGKEPSPAIEKEYPKPVVFEPAQEQLEPVQEALEPVQEQEPLEPVQEVLEPVQEMETISSMEEAQAPPPLVPQKPAGPTLFESLLEWGKTQFKKLGPKEAMGWEMALGTYWLPRIGIVVLAVGIVFLTTLAMQIFANAWWMPHARLGLGYLFCAGLLGIGRYLEPKAGSYARVLMAGGLSLTYFVTFATHYVPYTRVIETPAVTLMLLGIVVAVYMVITQVRKSRLLGFLGIGLGHFTVVLSTLTLAVPSRFAVAGLVLLSAAGAFFLLVNRWYYVAFAAMAGSYLNHFLWLWKSPSSDRPMDFAVALAILLIYFLTFSCAELFSPREVRRKDVPGWLRTIFINLNTGFCFSLTLLIFNSFSFAQAHDYIPCFGMAPILILQGWVYWRRRESDPALNTCFFQACALFTLGLAYYFDGPMLAVSVAVESVVLLAMARKSDLLVLRLLAFALMLLGFGFGVKTAFDMPYLACGDPGFWSHGVPALVTLLAFLAFALLYRGTLWVLWDASSSSSGAGFKELLWKLDVIAPPKNDRRSLDGYLWPYMATWAAIILGIIFNAKLWDLEDRHAVLAVAGLLLAAMGILLRMHPFTKASLVWTMASLMHGFSVWFRLPTGNIYEMAGYGGTLMLTLATWFPLLVLSELSRCFPGRDKPLWVAMGASEGKKPLFAFSDRIPPGDTMPYFYSILGGVLGFILIIKFTAHGHAVPITALVVLGLTGCAALRGAHPLGCGAMVILFLMAFLPANFTITGPSPLMFSAGLVCLLLTSLSCDQRLTGGRRGLQWHHGPAAPFLSAAVPGWLFARYVLFRMDGVPELSILLAGALAAALFALCWHREAWIWTALGLLLMLSLQWLGEHGHYPDTPWYTAYYQLFAFVITLALLLAQRFFAWRSDSERNVPGVLACIVAAVIMMAYCHQSCEPCWRYTGYACVVLGFLGYGIAFKTRTALIMSILFGAMTTILLVFHSFLKNGDLLHSMFSETFSTAQLLGGYAGIMAYWFILSIFGERIIKRFALTFSQEKRASLEALFVVVPFSLVVVLLERLPQVSGIYLTISWIFAAMAFLGYGLLLKMRAALIMSFLLGCVTTFLLVLHSYLKSGQRADTMFSEALTTAQLLAGYSAAMAYWFILSSFYVRIVNRISFSFSRKQLAALEALFVVVFCALAVVLLERIPEVSDFYLTISWTFAAVAFFGVFALNKQRYFRYTGLVTFLLALARVVIFDTRHLSGIYRVAAWIVLGVVLLVVGYGYIVAVRRLTRD